MTAEQRPGSSDGAGRWHVGETEGLPPHLDELPADGREGIRRRLVGAETGSVHLALDLLTVGAGQAGPPQVRAYETGLFVLAGTPSFTLPAGCRRLRPGDYLRIPSRTPHSWAADGPAQWVETCAPQPRPAANDRADHALVEAVELAPRGAQSWPGGHFDSERPRQPGSMFDGAAQGVSVDLLLGPEHHAAVHHTMFVVRFEQDGQGAVHDHPFEEAYLMLDGEADIEIDGTTRRMRSGMYAWSAVGAAHGFRPAAGAARWLEVQAPQPPSQHGFRPLDSWYPAVAMSPTGAP